MISYELIKIPKYNSKTQNIYFTSDLHLGHINIMKFCKRPFATIEEMDETLINNWNSVVEKDDIVFNLGDFAFATNSKCKEYITRLNGHHHLILGNHDIKRRMSMATMDLFESVHNQLLISIDNRKVYLNHYPFLCYAGTYKNPENTTIQLFGHVHTNSHNIGLDSPRMKYLFPYQYDVGVDNNNYTPILWQDVLLKIKKNENI